MGKNVKTDAGQDSKVQLPKGDFCSYRYCLECIYWNPYDRDSDGRPYCFRFDTYLNPGVYCSGRKHWH